jgi:hypothetical protein
MSTVQIWGGTVVSFAGGAGIGRYGYIIGADS